MLVLSTCGHESDLTAEFNYLNGWVIFFVGFLYRKPDTGSKMRMKYLVNSLTWVPLLWKTCTHSYSFNLIQTQKFWISFLHRFYCSRSNLISSELSQSGLELFCLHAHFFPRTICTWNLSCQSSAAWLCVLSACNLLRPAVGGLPWQNPFSGTLDLFHQITICLHCFSNVRW